MESKVTAKVYVSNRTEMNDGQVTVAFSPDYKEGRNSEWAKYTPALSLTMVVKKEVADHFPGGRAFTLVFDPEDSEGPLPTDGADSGTVVS